MVDGIGSFLSFFGLIVHRFFEYFFRDSGFLITVALSSPGDHPFETAFALFLVVLAVTLAIGIVWSVVKLDVEPFIRVSEWYTRVFGHIGAWILTVLIVAMVYEVVARYFFSAPTQWAFEMAYMLMGTSFMFGIAICMQYRRHIRVDFIYDHVNPKARAVIDLVGYLLLIPMLIWLSAGLWEYFHQAYRVEETSGESAWNPIIWPFKFSFVIGFVLLLLQTIVEFIKSILVLAGREVAGPPEIAGLQ